MSEYYAVNKEVLPLKQNLAGDGHTTTSIFFWAQLFKELNPESWRNPGLAKPRFKKKSKNQKLNLWI